MRDVADDLRVGPDCGIRSHCPTSSDRVSFFGSFGSKSCVLSHTSLTSHSHTSLTPHCTNHTAHWHREAADIFLGCHHIHRQRLCGHVITKPRMVPCCPGKCKCDCEVDDHQGLLKCLRRYGQALGLHLFLICEWVSHQSKIHFLCVIVVLLLFWLHYIRLYDQDTCRIIFHVNFDLWL